jgi:hypothetical protein
MLGLPRIATVAAPPCAVGSGGMHRMEDPNGGRRLKSAGVALATSLFHGQRAGRE